MFNGRPPKISRWVLVALYVLAMAPTAFGFAAHPHHGAGIAAARSLDAPICGHAAPLSERPASSPCAGCDACMVSEAPIAPNQIAHVVYVIEIATRLEFESSLGRRLDRRPDDLRSRAPPRVA
jgi:hypothetical protein